MRKYKYNGPVYSFGTCIANRFKAETVATSEEKARSNMAYQFKKKYGYTRNTNILLTGKMESEEM